MGEEQTRPTRRRTGAWRLAAVVAVAALTIGLFWAYLLQSRSQAANSDAAAQALQGWDLVHGHLLLRGWYLSDVSFYTFEVPLDGLIAVVYGLRSDVIHVAAAAEYALLVLFAALVAAGARRDRRRGGREAWVRGLIAAGIMVAPGAYPGQQVLLLAPDHTGIGVPVLIALLVVDRLRPRRLLPVVAAALLVCLLLTWAQLDDPVAAFSCALPLALACAAPLAAAAGRRLTGRMRARPRPPPGSAAGLAPRGGSARIRPRAGGGGGRVVRPGPAGESGDQRPGRLLPARDPGPVADLPVGDGSGAGARARPEPDVPVRLELLGQAAGAEPTTRTCT